MRPGWRSPIWGRWIAPKAPARLADPARLVAELGVFAAAVIALGLAAGPGLAAVFAAAVAVNEALLQFWGQREIAECFRL